MDDILNLHIVDYDGNLMDAAVLGSIAALLNTKIPETRMEDGELIIDREKMIPLPVKEKALMTTFAKIGGELLVDPSLEEEQIMDARISIGIREDGRSVLCKKAEPIHSLKMKYLKLSPCLKILLKNLGSISQKIKKSKKKLFIKL